MTATTSETFKRFATSGVDWAVMMEDEERQLREYRIATLRQAIEEQTRDFKAPFIIHVSDLEKCVTAEDIYYFFGGADKLDDIFFFQDDEADHVLVEFNNLEALIEALMKNGTVFFKKQIKIQYVEACKNRCYVIPKTSDAVEPSPPPLSSSKEPEVSPSDSVQWRATNNQSPRYSEQPPRSSDSNRRGDSRPRGSGNRRDGAPRSNERRNGPRSNDRQRDAYPRSNERRDGPPRNDRPQLASYSDSKDRPRQPKPPHSNDARQQYERSSNRAPPSKYDMQGGSRGSRPSQAQPEFVVPPPPQLKAQQNLPKPDEPQVPKPAEPATTKPAEKKNPFGEARPMDTQKRMLEMDEKLRNEKATKPVVEAKPTQPTTTEYSKPVQDYHYPRSFVNSQKNTMRASAKKHSTTSQSSQEHQPKREEKRAQPASEQIDGAQPKDSKHSDTASTKGSERKHSSQNKTPRVFSSHRPQQPHPSNNRPAQKVDTKQLQKYLPPNSGPTSKGSAVATPPQQQPSSKQADQVASPVEKPKKLLQDVSAPTTPTDQQPPSSVAEEASGKSKKQKSGKKKKTAKPDIGGNNIFSKLDEVRE